MRANAVIRARVTEVHEYGLWLEAEGLRGFVQPTELTWSGRGVRPSDVASAGDCIAVYVYAVTGDRFFEGYDFEHGLGWRRYLTGSVQIASAPGDHLDILTAHTTAQVMHERLGDLNAACQAARSSTASSQRRGYAGSRA